MIRISCTNCKTILSIDDAFAGGVCRCQHCGTIQTVPAQLRGNAAQVAASGHAIGGVKSLYQQNGDPQGAAGTGLDDLASVVVSSGLGSRRLRAGDASKPSMLLPVLIGSGVLMIVLVFVIIFLLNRNNTATVPPGSSGTAAGGGTSITAGGAGTPTPAITTPNFCGMPLAGNTIVYLLNRGTATNYVLGDLKDVTIKSARSLTADRKFAILFWSEHDSPVISYPEKTTTYATEDSIKSAEAAIRDVTGYGQPEINNALQQALTLNPDEIVVATANGLNLGDSWLDSVLAIRGNSTVKIDAFNVGRDVEIAPLKRLAEQTGGKYHDVTQGNLQLLAK